MADGNSRPYKINDLAVEQIYAVGERLDCSARTTLAGSRPNTVRLRLWELCHRDFVAMGNRGGTAPTVCSWVNRTALGQAPAYADG